MGLSRICARRKDDGVIDNYATVFILGAFAFLGVWMIVDPAGIISWAKRAHPTLREDDPSVRFFARFIGVCWISLCILLFLAWLFSRYR